MSTPKKTKPIPQMQSTSEEDAGLLLVAEIRKLIRFYDSHSASKTEARARVRATIIEILNGLHGSHPSSKGQKELPVDGNGFESDIWSNFRYSGFSLESSFQPQTGEFWSLNPGDLEDRADAIVESNEENLLYADEMRKSARALREIEEHPEVARRRVYSEWGLIDLQIFPEAFFLASWNNDKEMLDFIARQAEKFCEHVGFLADRGNVNAARHIAHLAILLTSIVCRLAESDPKALRPIASDEVVWPVMDSPQPKLKSPQPDWNKLGLGSSFPIKLNESRRFKLNTPVGKIAWQLWLYVFKLKRKAEAYIAAKDIDLDEFKSKWAQAMNPSIPDAAVLLPEFTNDRSAVVKWWELAERCLTDAFHKHGKLNELNEEAPIFADLVTSAKHKATPGKWRSRIIHKLSEAFNSIAGVPDDKKKKPA